MLDVLLDYSVAVGKKNKELHLLEIQKQNVIKKLARFGNASQAKLRVQIETQKAEEHANKKWSDLI